MIHPKRRSGRPRANWTEETIREIWDIIKRNNPTHRYQQFDENNEAMVEAIKHYEEK
jgi:protein gp37